MKTLKKLAGVVGGLMLLNACAPVTQQQPWNGQVYSGGGQQQQPYGNQQAYGYGSQGDGSTTSVLGTAAGLALIGILTGQLGINPQQALGGVGSIFQVAQQRLQPADFSRLSNAVPGMDQYLAAAPQPVAANGSNSLWGAAGNLMGGPSSNLGSLMGLAGSFQSLGMNADMIGRFVPVMLQYVQQQGGAATSSLLETALR